MQTCKTCAVELGPKNRSGLCRPCYVQGVVDSKKKPIPHCGDCGVDVSRRCRIGLCRQCYIKKYCDNAENKARRSAAGRAWAAANPEKHRNKSLAWQKANPDRVKEIRLKTSTSDRGRFTRERGRAERRGLTWTLTQDELSEYRKKPCTYCGSPLDTYGGGLDRIDNDKGYSNDNVTPCCGTCNRIRGDSLSYDEMIAAMRAVVAFRRREKLRVVKG